MPFQRKAGLFTQGTLADSRGSNRPIDQYNLDQTGLRRHQFVSSSPAIGIPQILIPGEYFISTLCQFRRSFGGGADDPPTPTVGNNYQTPEVFNGGRIENMNASITLKNGDATNPATLTVYEVALSFYDAAVLDLLNTAISIFQFLTATANAGDVTERAVSPIKMQENVIKSSKFAQHYYRKLGTITLGNLDQATSTAVLTVTQVPGKCRRSQSGMYFAYVFVNDTEKNNARTLDIEYSLENNFDEIPASNRLPYLY